MDAITDGNRKGRRIAVFALPLAALSAFLAFRFLPEIPLSGTTFCFLLRTTGLYCATCGATRASFALAQGDLASAFGYNPLFVLLLPFVAYVALAAYLRLLPIRFRLPLPRAWTGILISLTVTLVLYTILRNLPWSPFPLLAP